MNAVQLPDELVKAIVLKSGGSWGDGTHEDREFFRRLAGFVAAYEREACGLIVLDNSDAEGICCTDDVLEAFRQRGETNEQANIPR
jgi:hypothetical protein